MMPRILITGGAGYIGSRLRPLFPDASSVDLELYGNPAGLPNARRAYQSLDEAGISAYDVIIHLAAHSSVAQCIQDPDGAVANNLTGFAELLRLCRGKRLLYASSSSVYGGCGAEQATEIRAGFQPANRYDVSKYAMDLLAQTSDIDFYSLRLGTVCGWSPNLRTDLMINRMVKDACERGVVTVTNPSAHRPILDIDDLCRAVQAIVAGEGPPGVYNLASLNSTVEEVASAVAGLCGVSVRTAPSSPTYDFSMGCGKFCGTYRFTFCGSVESIVRGLLAHPGRQGGGRP